MFPAGVFYNHHLGENDNTEIFFLLQVSRYNILYLIKNRHFEIRITHSTISTGYVLILMVLRSQVIFSTSQERQLTTREKIFSTFYSLEH